jgi:D-alanyl-D-alanine carboxypeptidase/D-alanyl-D-alanine-endopeptidase (penicillin-binding protein 4)
MSVTTPQRPSGRFKSAFCAILVMVVPVLAAGAPPAPAGSRPPVARWLEQAGIDPRDVGIAIHRLDAPGAAPAWGLNAGQAFNPASTMKLLTTWAALSILGPDFRWRTSLHPTGPIVDGVLHGDLVLRGGGDPKLVVEDLEEWIRHIRQAGLREIRGSLVIDDARFEPVDESRPPFDGEAAQPYNVQPAGALMNFKATRLVVRPEAGAVRIELDPPLADVRIDNRVRLLRGPCRSGAAGLRVYEAAAGPGAAPVIRVEGPYSQGCGEQGSFAAVLDHVAFARAFFAAAWRGAGGVWQGGARLGRGEAEGPPWAEWISPRTLAEVVDDVNHFSNNVMARLLLMQVAAAAGARPAGEQAGAEAVQAWLRARGLVLPELVLDNGAGLSREARISPANLARVLADADRSPLGERFRDSLPRVGETGTVRHRLVGEPVAGRAWIKTGSLAGVRAIAGYLEAASGRRYVIVMLVNGPRAGASGAAQDALLRWLHAHG